MASDMNLTPKNEKRFDHLIKQYEKTGNVVGLVNLIGGSAEDFTGVHGHDDGEQRGAPDFV